MKCACDECGRSGGYALYCLRCADLVLKKDWVSLTEQQIKSILSDNKCWIGDDCSMPNLNYIVRLVESALREKNT